MEFQTTSPSLIVSSSPSLPVSFKPWPGLQIHTTCRLWLVRDTRRGEKAHDQQRRLERYHQQRPGGL
ncbi:MAG: hypothetical protein Q8M07_32285 [Prosthecobacter sp.]|nr:hypothetical protein [Prosthecobacter sp.]